MNFKKILVLFLVAFMISCKNPYLTDPGFNPGIPEFNFLPVNESDVRWMQPYGFVDFGTSTSNHIGFDFGVKSSGTPFYSCGDGVVSRIEYNTGKGYPGTNYSIVIQVSFRVFIDYHFEIGGSVSEDERKRNIFVKQGDYVKAGEKIANLISVSDAAHVDFGIRLDDKRDKCPLYFFTTEADIKLEALFDSVEKRPVRDNLCE
ncbi:MAG: M23 family metallopeptidase [Candidatus Goldbacteria bacterium]|nr:M23 family metallopeptidase [Candidatus Goldiibacteriota bacterium]HPD19593.1 M23 family metallopeptidase [Candidatus Goldiibacteriota bacterium]